MPEGEEWVACTAANEANGYKTIQIDVDSVTRTKILALSAIIEADPWKEVLFGYRRRFVDAAQWHKFHNDSMAPRHRATWQGELFLDRLHSLLIHVWDPTDLDVILYSYAYEVLP